MAKKFKFSLQTVRMVRKREEEAQQRRFAEAARKVVAAKEERSSMENIRCNSQDQIRVLATEGNIPREDLAIYRSHTTNLWVEIIRIENIIRNLEDEAEQERQKLITAISQRKALDLLEEKQRAEFNKMLDKEEEKMLDEIKYSARASK